ncbi:hypothetical protein JCGZ_03068 [Jatropha curcas]|uniref:Amino acid transporter transmembrane domain-containing protein n=1 Tax=Jatropha curcas TaxID=180498 RepID=A0A067JPI7_JATCU|nr:amino acid transporter ANT1 [Jatropha curcas]KDP21930.1 hypothetical protein JCGZ_03068 [Jatropha curcas]
MGTEFHTTAALLESSPSTGTASAIQTFGNIIVSVVGTGILGLPFAFRIAGWLAGSIGVIVAGIATYYCMLLLVQCRDKQASQEPTQETKTFGDLGYKCLGNAGRFLTEFLIFISQCGGSVAYLVFIGQNLASIFKSHSYPVSSFIFFLVLIEIALSWIGSLSSLASFSIIADICNIIAMAVVVKEEVEKLVSGEFKFSDRIAFTSNIGGLAFAGGMAVFCFGGLGMTLALEGSMKEKQKFPSLLAKAFTGIILVYVSFGFSGYMAYGDQTEDIVTLNLLDNWSTIAVQIGLCLGLVFTFPMMVHPLHEIIEGKLENSEWYQKLCYKNDETLTRNGKFGRYASRAVLIVVLGVLASFVPGFGVFVSLVGSTVCAMISFVLPAIFHLIILGPSLNFWQKAFDYCFLICGSLFACYGTYNTIFGA